MSKFEQGNKVAVVGSGIIGLVQAYVLAKAGIDVSIYGLRQQVGMGSLAAIGIVSSKGHKIARQKDFAFKLYGQKAMMGFCNILEKESGIAIDIQVGVFEPYTDREAHDKIINRAFYRQNLDLLNVSVLNKEQKQLSQLYNHIDRRKNIFEGSYYYPEDYWVDTQAMLAALHKILANHPLVTIVDKMVINCDLTEDIKWKLRTADNSVFLADELIVAVGSDTTNFLNNTIGVSYQEVRAVSGFTLRTQRGGYDKGLSALFGRNSLVVASRHLLYGSSKTSIEPVLSERLAYVAKLEALGLVEAIDRGSVESYWGSRALSKDRWPLIGPVPHKGKNIYLNTAHYKNGFQLAYPSAKIILNYLTQSEMESSNRNSSRSLSLRARELLSFRKAFHPARAESAASTRK